MREANVQGLQTRTLWVNVDLWRLSTTRVPQNEKVKSFLLICDLDL